MSEPKKTPLAEEHERLGGRMVDFAGWYMPVQYEGLKPEHLNVRENVGLFDVSHMGEFRAKGPKALETLQWVTTNDVAKLEEGDAQYTLFPNANGGVVDDLIVYCLKKNEDYLLCVNAANIDKDWAFINENNRGADLTNESEAWAQIAVQGPKAMDLVAKVLADHSDLGTFKHRPIEFNGTPAIIARTGYTGEDGVEVFVEADQAVSLWSQLVQAGGKPAGLGARDTLRTEAKFPLYGHELSDETNPYSAGLGWVVKPKAKDFLGKEAMLEQKPDLTHKLIGFKTLERGIPREGYPLFSFDNIEIGKVTSGTMSPSFGFGFGMGYVLKEYADAEEIQVDIRGRKVKSATVKSLLKKS